MHKDGQLSVSDGIEKPFTPSIYHILYLFVTQNGLNAPWKITFNFNFRYDLNDTKKNVKTNKDVNSSIKVADKFSV